MINVFGCMVVMQLIIGLMVMTHGIMGVYTQSSTPSAVQMCDEHVSNAQKLLFGNNIYQRRGMYSLQHTETIVRDIHKNYRIQAKNFHPDKTGNAMHFNCLTKAKEEFLVCISTGSLCHDSRPLGMILRINWNQAYHKHLRIQNEISDYLLPIVFMIIVSWVSRATQKV